MSTKTQQPECNVLLLIILQVFHRSFFHIFFQKVKENNCNIPNEFYI